MDSKLARIRTRRGDTGPRRRIFKIKPTEGMPRTEVTERAPDGLYRR